MLYVGLNELLHIIALTLDLLNKLLKKFSDRKLFLLFIYSKLL